MRITHPITTYVSVGTCLQLKVDVLQELICRLGLGEIKIIPSGQKPRFLCKKLLDGLLMKLTNKGIYKDQSRR